VSYISVVLDQSKEGIRGAISKVAEAIESLTKHSSGRLAATAEF
jgi:hypothetical protein